jgi:hypothetical protein
VPTHQSQSGLEFVSESSDLAAGAGMFIFTLAPFSLPFWPLTALAAVALLIPVLVGLMLAAPFLLARRWLRLRDWLSGDTKRSRYGDGKARLRRRGSVGALGRPVVPDPVGHHRLNPEASQGAGEMR